jgi:hypothetical protein
MKFKYIDKRNVRNLLRKMSIPDCAEKIEDALQHLSEEIAEKNDATIDQLIERNAKTVGLSLKKRLMQLDAPHSVVIIFEKKYQDGDWGILTKGGVYDFRADAKKEKNAKKLLGTIPDHMQFMFSMIDRCGITESLIMPFQCLLKGWGDVMDGYQCYTHKAARGEHNMKNVYAGITKRGWQERFDEHLSSARNGGNGLFHKHLREDFLENSEDKFISHHLLMVNATFEEAMKWEEEFVDRWTLAPKGLNMIPGGFEGIKFLHKHAVFVPRNPTEKQLDDAKAEFFKRHPRVGFENPAISECWKSDEYYEKAICGRENSLSPNQVRWIRALHEDGLSDHEIMLKVRARNEKQVSRVITGQTYSRIR